MKLNKLYKYNGRVYRCRCANGYFASLNEVDANRRDLNGKIICLVSEIIKENAIISQLELS